MTRVAVEPPRDPAHGDLSTNAAMILAKPAKMPPRDLAQKLAARLAQETDITAADVAGPGFINLKIADAFWQARIVDILEARTSYGDSDLGQNKRVNIEYVSANPTGPMHAGHVRGAVLGDALANLLEKAGYEVTREYYFNDAGAQVDTLARTAHLRYREALGENIGAIPEGLYPGEYMKDVGAA
ncbi:MAG TPA: arginine--tRNA ligase, partial [Stellaceae bacterium]|nr:arginine--tRNA ligase [Stellaceae bacterium]